MGGYHKGYLEDVVIFDEETMDCTQQELKSFAIGFWAFGNQCVQLKHNEVVAYIYDGANLHYKAIKYSAISNKVEII